MALIDVSQQAVAVDEGCRRTISGWKLTLLLSSARHHIDVVEELA